MSASEERKDQRVKVRSIALEKLRFAVARRVLAEFPVEVEPEVYADHFSESADLLAMELTAMLAGRKEIEKKQLMVPIDWWQHFKLRWFAGWMKRLWPVQMEVLTLMETRVCPHIPTKDMRPHIEFLQADFNPAESPEERGAGTTYSL